MSLLTSASASAEPRLRIAVVTDRMDDARAQVIGGVESVVRPAGGSVLAIVHHRQNPWRGALLGRLLAHGQFDAVVVLPLNAMSGPSRLAELRPLLGGVPTVVVGSQDVEMPYVEAAESGLAARVMDHLVADCGRSRPLLISTPTAPDVLVTRRGQALEHAALARGIRLVQIDSLRRCVDRHGARVALSAWLQRQEEHECGLGFDSVVATSDELAIGAVGALVDLGVAVPDDVAVIGYGATDAAWGATPPLTTVDDGLRSRGAAAAEYLLARLRGDDVATHGRVARVLDDGLLVRASTRAFDDAESLLVQLAWDDVAEPVRTGPTWLQAQEDERGREVGWRQGQRLRRAVQVIERSHSAALPRLTPLSGTWHQLIGGELDHAGRAKLSRQLAEVVSDYPEPEWWRAWLEISRHDVESHIPSGTSPGVARLVMMATSLTVERALGDSRELRERTAHLQSQEILELKQSLTGCASVVDMNVVLRSYVQRLGLLRFFVGLYDRPLRASSLDRTVDNATRELPPMRLVMEYVSDGAVSDPEPADGRNVIGAGDLLPERLADHVDRATLMVQPLFGADGYYGFFAYEGSGRDRHVGESLGLVMSRVLESRARTDDLEARSHELAELVAARTTELELEIVNRRQAQDGLRKANEHLRSALLRDGLTGLYNRPAFDEHLERVWRATTRTGSTCCVLMCDVDHFKLFNDTAGHLAGDDGLRQVAAVLQPAAARPSDMVARYGGEEFVVILDHTDLAGATVVADRLGAAMRQAALPHPGLPEGSTLTISIGVACCEGYADPRAMLLAADRALYRAKVEGRDDFRVDPGPGRELASR